MKQSTTEETRNTGETEQGVTHTATVTLHLTFLIVHRAIFSPRDASSAHSARGRLTSRVTR